MAFYIQKQMRNKRAIIDESCLQLRHLAMLAAPCRDKAKKYDYGGLRDLEQ